MRILGIDPGLRTSGYGVVELRPGSVEPVLIEGGVIRVPASGSLAERLTQLEADLNAVIAEFHPDAMAVEKLYAHYNHPRTAILMGHARGVILLCAAREGIPTHDLPANLVKKSMTGYGHASKEQMQRAVQSQFKLAALPEPADVADAIAIATCHARRVAISRL